MSFSHTSEVAHYRSKSVSPQSPRPIHIPEPANIPVLQNQIDPVFNLMSTHLEAPHPMRNLTAMDYGNVHSHESTSDPLPASALADVDNDFYNDSNASDSHESVDESADYILVDEKEVGDGGQVQKEASSNLQTHLSPSTLQPSSTSLAAYELLYIPQTYPTPVPHGQSLDTSEAYFEPTSYPTETSPDLSKQPDQDSTAIELDPQSAPEPQTNGFHVQSQEGAGSDTANEDVNYQALLDNLSPSTASAPTAETVNFTKALSPSDTSNVPIASNNDAPLATLPTPVGLPPRPPPQEQPAIHPNYTPGKDIRSYHFPPAQNSNGRPSHSSQPNNSYRPSQSFSHTVVAGGAPGTASTANGLPPPPLATFQQPQAQSGQAQKNPHSPQTQSKDNSSKNGAVGADDGDEGIPWDENMKQKYQEFTQDEVIYVAEGLWDRFPPGSRLFVGNLFSEKVHKRDLFTMFHRYGKLAQISIKQAYGFIQFLDSASCLRALQAEQGSTLKGRKLHLEVSKPQKNTRNAAPSAAGDSLRATNGRRSPDYGRGGAPMRGSGQRMSGDRYDRGLPFSDYRDEPRRRDDYRPMRSPSPRGFRGRDEYRGGRGRSPDRYYRGRSRSRSPYGMIDRYRSRSPRGRELDDDAVLPLARRDPRDVPDVQIILLDEVDRTFVAYIEKSFRDRGLRCDILQLPRIPLDAVIKRQILEGVQAVVKIIRQSQVTGKIPLQVFDRRGGVDHVRFEEYDQLDANIAAELVVRAKSTHMAPPIPQYPPQPPYVPPQYNQPMQLPPQQQQGAAPPNLANLITSLDGPALQKLLGAMQQNPQTPQTPQALPPQQAPTQVPDLAALLGSVPRPQPQQQGYPYALQPQPQHQTQQQNPYGAPVTNNAFATNPGLANLLTNAGQRPLQQSMPQQGQAGQQNVQNIMDQLARYRQ